MVLVVGGGAGGRHVQCGNDAVDKLDAGYIRDSGSEGRMERERVSGRKRENLRQTPHWAQSPTLGSIP